MESIHIPPLAPEVLFMIGDISITNTMVNAWIAIIFFLVFGLFLRRRLRLRPGRLQNGVEYILDSLLEYFDQVTGDRKASYNQDSWLLFHFNPHQY